MSIQKCLNYGHASLNQQMKKTQADEPYYCFGCLTKNIGFINLMRCKHADIIESFIKTQTELVNHYICYECHALLVKFYKFRMQVQESFSILKSQSLHKLPKHFNHKKIKLEKVQLRSIDTTEQRHEQTFTTPNREYDEILKSNSNFINEPEISDDDKDSIHKDINGENTLVSDETVEQKIIQKNQIYDIINHVEEIIEKKPIFHKNSKVLKYAGKIREITLNDEQLLLERENESKNENYLHLPYKCESCIIGFVYKTKLQDHNEKNHKSEKNNDNVCNICKTVFSIQSSYRSHAKGHYKRFECVRCKRQFKCLEPALQHYNDSHEKIRDFVYQCQQCDFVSDNPSTYKHHLNKHRGMFKCADCDKAFVYNCSLQRHIHTVHKGQKPAREYVCKQCGKVFIYRSSYVVHVEANHSDDTRKEKAYCVDCGTEFKTRHSYLAHLKKHKNHRRRESLRYECDYCGEKFQFKFEISHHISFKHLNDKKFKCTLCDNKVFITNSRLRLHISRVHLKKPIPRDKICSYCGRGFTSAQILQNHIRTHTGERPLKCKHCPADFAHPASLYTHNKTLHKNN